MRAFNRDFTQLRPIKLQRQVNKYAEGSCLVEFGDTKVLCTASLEERVPKWLHGAGKGGWLSAEYNMLPRATKTRTKRESTVGKQTGRTLEIQRLIGRSLRSVMDLKALGNVQILIDCDVLQADGGTRCAAITGAWIALYDCLGYMQSKQMASRDKILKDQVVAVACGIKDNQAMVDFDYEEDCCAQIDANFILSGSGDLIEIQSTGEVRPFSEEEFLQLLGLAKNAAAQILALQQQVITG